MIYVTKIGNKRLQRKNEQLVNKQIYIKIPKMGIFIR